MRSWLLFVAAACAVWVARAVPVQVGAPHPLSSLAQDERPLGLKGWSRVGVPPPTHTVSLTFAVAHTDPDALEALWLGVALPGSPDYLNFKTREELAAVIGPDPASVQTLTSWVLDTCPHATVTPTTTGDFLSVQTTAQCAEKLLSVRLGLFRSPDASLPPLVRTTDPVVLPPAIAPLVDVVGGVSEFTAGLRKSGKEGRRERGRERARAQLRAGDESNAPYITFIDVGNQYIQVRYQPRCNAISAYDHLCNTTTFAAEIAGVEISVTSQALPWYNTTVAVADLSCENESDPAGDWVVECSAWVDGIENWQMLTVVATTVFTSGDKSNSYTAPATVMCTPYALPHNIAKMYNVTKAVAHTNSTAGVILFEGEFYSPSDMTSFLKGNDLPSTPAAVVNPTDPNDPTYPGEEAQADIELIAANGVGGEASTFWYSSNDQNGVLLWAQQVANASDETVPKMWSLSWGIPESQFDTFLGAGTQKRINTELKKMGVRGLTLVVASGDAGVREIGRSEVECGVFLPSFPASSPYVLTVSATMLQPPATAVAPAQPSVADLPICDVPMEGKKISCNETGLAEAVEVAVSCCDQGSVWTTGGGFSTNYTRPSWQSAAVSAFLANQHEDLPPATYWNSTGRAFPDVAVIGDKVLTLRNGEVENFGGTSASAPIMAGLLAVVNAARLANNKGLLGPVTPTLYSLYAQFPQAFNDITVGHNNCGELMCCQYGFQSVSGWDPVTGLGTPNLGVLQELLLAV